MSAQDYRWGHSNWGRRFWAPSYSDFNDYQFQEADNWRNQLSPNTFPVHTRGEFHSERSPIRGPPMDWYLFWRKPLSVQKSSFI